MSLVAFILNIYPGVPFLSRFIGTSEITFPPVLIITGDWDKLCLAALPKNGRNGRNLYWDQLKGILLPLTERAQNDSPRSYSILGYSQPRRSLVQLGCLLVLGLCLLGVSEDSSTR